MNKKDLYCWKCHRDNCDINCHLCDRSYHLRCIRLIASPKSSQWICYECEKNSKTQRLTHISCDALCHSLNYTMKIVKKDSDQFFEDISHDHRVTHPMDLKTIDYKLRLSKYESLHSFIADIQWILHNCIICRKRKHPLTRNFKNVLKLVYTEVRELQICVECYVHSHTVKDHPFAEPCKMPHSLVLVKVEGQEFEGHPLWPAKAMTRDNRNCITCKLFGTHQSVRVQNEHVWLLSEDHCDNVNDDLESAFNNAMKELTIHINRLNKKFPELFQYAPKETPFDSKMLFLFKINDNCDEKQIRDAQSYGKRKRHISMDDISVNNDMENPSQESSNILKMETLSMETQTMVSQSILSQIMPSQQSSITPSQSVSQMPFRNGIRENDIRENDIRENHIESVPNQLDNLKKRKFKAKPSIKSKKSQSKDSAENTMQSNKFVTIDLNKVNADDDESVTRIEDTSDDDGNNKDFRNHLKNCAAKFMEDLAIGLEWQRKRDNQMLHKTTKKIIAAAIDEVKSKLWCGNCKIEAVRQCCTVWYCSGKCQEEHWNTHAKECCHQKMFGQINNLTINLTD